MPSLPKVSICLPVLNTGRYLRERIRTITEQTFSDFEVIVIDGFSDDGSWELLKETAKNDVRFRLFQEPRQGIYPAINLAVQRAVGEFIYVATSDDTMVAECLERMVGALEQHPECGLASCELFGLDRDGNEVAGFWGCCPNAASFATDSVHAVRPAPHDGLLHCRGVSVYVSLTQLLIRRKIFADLGFFKTTWGSIGDFEWNTRASLVFSTVHVPQQLASWRRHPGQATNDDHILGSGRLTYLKKVEEMIVHALSTAKKISRDSKLERISYRNATAWVRSCAFWHEYSAKSGVPRWVHLGFWMLKSPDIGWKTITWRLGFLKTFPFGLEEEKKWLSRLFDTAGTALRSPFTS